MHCNSPRVADSDATLAAEDRGDAITGYYFEVNGPGAAAVPSFIPTLHELLQVLDYWVRVDAELSFWFFMTGDSTNPAWRLQRFAQRRIKRIREALGDDARVRDFVEARYEEQGDDRDTLAWRVFRHSDDGIIGAEFVKRPGFLRLMNALRPRPAFQVLVMSEESRLGREQIETAYALKQITDAGVRVFFYLEDRERTLDNPIDKVMLSLTNFASEMERERARQRTYDAMLRKAKALHVTGGKVFGYDNVEITSPDTGKRVHVTRRVNADQAEVVRRIFEMYAAGLGFKRIADALNKRHVPSPRAGRGGRFPACGRCCIASSTAVSWSGIAARRSSAVEPKSSGAARLMNGCGLRRRSYGSCPRSSGLLSTLDWKRRAI